MPHDPKLVRSIEDAAIACVLGGPGRQMTERQKAETMMKVFDEAILAAIRPLEAQISFLRGWLKSGGSDAR